MSILTPTLAESRLDACHPDLHALQHKLTGLIRCVSFHKHGKATVALHGVSDRLDDFLLAAESIHG